MNAIKRTTNFVNDLRKKYGRTAIKVFLGAIVVALHIFLGLAIGYNFNTAVALLCFMCIGWLGAIYYLLLSPALAHFSPQIGAFFNPINVLWKRAIVRMIVYIALFAAFIVFLVVITSDSWLRKVSIGGLIFYIVLSVLLSNNAARVSIIHSHAI